MSELLSSSPSSLSRPGMPDAIWVDEDGTFHEWYTALIFINQQYLGQFKLDPGAHSALGYRRSGIAYYCRFCGQVWARIVFSNSNGEQQTLDVESVGCEKHSDQWNQRGSLLAGRLENLLPLLPEAVVKREFIIHQRDLGE